MAVFDLQDPIYLKLKKVNKSIYVQNTYENESFEYESSEFISLNHFFQNQVSNKITLYRKEEIKSEIYTPLYYLTHDRNYICIGYIQIQSKTKHLTIEEDFNMIKKLNEELIERMQKINTVSTEEKEEILNISKDGFRARIKNPNLINYSIYQSGFTCDIVPREQKPFSIYAEIRSSLKKENILDLGVKIIDFTNGEPDNKRLLELISFYEKKCQIDQSMKKT